MEFDFVSFASTGSQLASFVSSQAVPMLASTLTCAWLLVAEQTLAFTTLLAEVPLLTKWLGYISVGLQVAAGLGFVIFVHELGHFLAAKTFGVKCEKFYVGFDIPISLGPVRLPRTLGKFRWGETEYGIGIVPLGGYVKMLGQDDDPRNSETEAERIRLGGGPDAPLDPRSYQAKPVWQRMIIISAGVVMNVIFAVFLAAAAFLYGVPYTPTIIGASPIGSPAWQAGLQPGDRVVQMAKMKQDDPYLRFEDMGGKTIMHGFKHKDAPIPFTVERAGARLTVVATPTTKLHPQGYYLVGINPTSIATVGSEVSKYSYLAAQNIQLQPGDRIVAVDGEPLPVDKDTGKILSGPLTDHFQAKWNQPVELTILRSAEPTPSKSASASSQDKMAPPQEVKVTLPPVPVKSLGIGFAMGPISAIKKGSLAETAGLQVGDVIQSIDGEPVSDALRLPTHVAEKLGKPIEFTIRRGKAEPSTTKDSSKAANSNASNEADSAGQEMKFTLQSDSPPAFGTVGQITAQLGLENFGIAYSVLPKVSYVDPNSAKASAAVKVGDVLTQLKFELTPEEIADFKDNGATVSTETVPITTLRSIPSYFSVFQQLPEGVKVRCFLQRNEEVREVILPLQFVKDWFWVQRGVPMQPLEKIQKTTNVLQALSWGVTETGRKLGDVFEFLTILVSGKASPRNLAGPFGIAEVAANEASDSPSRLLLFLTLLSANLAILNLLPIPALDGGHLMFLIAEAIRGKPLNEALQVRLTMVGVMCLLGLMAFAVLNDILRKIM